jgi:hypothetical protein
MASDYWTISIAVDKEEVPINFQSINDFPKGNERSMSIGYSHRTPDLLIALRSIVESYQKSHLAYLYEPATVVDPIAIQRAIADINWTHRKSWGASTKNGLNKKYLKHFIFRLHRIQSPLWNMEQTYPTWSHILNLIWPFSLQPKMPNGMFYTSNPNPAFKRDAAKARRPLTLR